MVHSTWSVSEDAVWPLLWENVGDHYSWVAIAATNQRSQGQTISYYTICLAGLSIVAYTVYIGSPCTYTMCAPCSRRRYPPGLRVPEIELKNLVAAYANDTHFLLHADYPNLLMAKSILQWYSIAIGLYIQWAKSEARWLAREDYLACTEDLNWMWKEPGADGELLGFSF